MSSLGGLARSLHRGWHIYEHNTTLVPLGYFVLAFSSSIKAAGRRDCWPRQGELQEMRFGFSLLGTASVS